ncbi:hypothetical protein BE17_44695 [Sorangium cellulosum]|uniref:RCC1-like domain-containing protein n=1 Tax=Sorangium cellulosum TaxID=56 RepID=A0A150SGB2_SORCE|nr:hypothetical protein BE17_44695 [Sorangium cellulosum]
MKMKRMRSAAAAAALVVAVGCNQIAGIREGIPREEEMAACAAVDDCAVAVPECRAAVACEGGTCVFDDAIEGTPLQEQTEGDCAQLVCDGSGKTKLVPLENDAPDDGKVCTLDTCEGTLPRHTPQTELPCYSGPRATRGKGVCVDGVQRCDEEGNPVGGCEGEVLPQDETCISPLDEDCDGKANEEGPACLCQPGAIELCYTDTGGVEVCGTRSCSADGRSWGACVGERAPETETCDAAETDEDCDGEVNEEGADCQCGDGYVSNSEECDDGNTDIADTCAECVSQQLTSIDAGNNHACVVIWSGKLKCWGGNSNGMLGLGDSNNRGDQTAEMGAGLPTLNLGARKTADSIATGGSHTCARLNDKSVKCWGYNNYGQLGLGSSNRVVGDSPTEMGDNLAPVNLGADKTAIIIAAGDSHTCASLNDRSVKCWGHNNYGQLGLGSTTSVVGDSSAEMGDNLAPVNLGTDKLAVLIATGGSHTCVTLWDDSLKCWGNNNYGQLGLGSTANVVGDSSTEMGDNLAPVNLGTNKTTAAIAAGQYHTCALLNDNSVKCWGYNNYGQLGLGRSISYVGRSATEMGDNLAPVDLGAHQVAIDIAAGDSHTCALLDDNSVKCWGYNNYGQLGLERSISYIGRSATEMGDNLAPVNLGTGKTAIAIAAGQYHTCALLNDNSVKCWGYNSSGQLGLGNTNTVGDSSAEMGDNLPTVKLFSDVW